MAKRDRKEKDNWKKKRRQEHLEKKEFRYYIFCEGQATEPKYFQGFKRYIEDNPIYRDMVLIEIEGCQAETMRVIGKAEEYVRENKITKGQIWCVYDKDSFPASDVNGVVQRAEALNQQNPDIQYHAAWSNECIEFWFATVYKGNIIKNLIMDCQSYTKYRPNETTGGIFVSWRRKEELPTGA